MQLRDLALKETDQKLVEQLYKDHEEICDGLQIVPVNNRRIDSPAKKTQTSEDKKTAIVAASPIKNRRLFRHATTPSPKKKKATVGLYDMDDDDSAQCYWDYVKMKPVYISHGHPQEADDVAEDGGFICGLWKTLTTEGEAETWKKWQSEMPYKDYLEVVEAREEPLAQPKAPKTKKKILKRPASAVTTIPKLVLTWGAAQRSMMKKWGKNRIAKELKENKTKDQRHRFARSRIWHFFRDLMKENNIPQEGHLKEATDAVMVAIKDQLLPDE